MSWLFAVVNHPPSICIYIYTYIYIHIYIYIYIFVIILIIIPSCVHFNEKFDVLSYVI